MGNTFISDYAVVEPLPALRAGRAGPAKSYVKGGEYGRGSVQFSAEMTATDTITLNGVVIEFSASATDFTNAGTVADPMIMQLTGTLATTVGNLVTALNGAANASLAVATYSYNSTGAGDTLTIVYDTLADASSYTIVTAALTDAPTAASTAITGGQAVVTLSADYENIDIAITDSNHQYFTLADALETTKKTILLSAKSTGDAVISINGSNVTLDTANQYLKLQFLGGDWRTLVDPSASALNDLTPTDSNFIVGNGTTWVAETGNTVLASIGTTSTTTELDYLDLTTGPGTQEASKAVVADANVNTGVSKVTELHIGASGSEVQVTATPAELNRAADLTGRIVSIAATGAVTEAAHEGRELYVTGTAANTQTLPEATGSGARYRFIIGEVNTNGTVLVVADTTNANFIGSVNILDLDLAAQAAYGCPANCDTITLNGTTTGGQIGDFVELVDVATDVWMVFGQLQCPTGSNPVTPFSAAV